MGIYVDRYTEILTRIIWRDISRDPQFKFLLKFSAIEFDWTYILVFEHDIRFQTLAAAGRGSPREYNEIIYRLETVLYFRITNTFFSTTLGTNKHAVNRFLCPFCAYVPGKGFFFYFVGRWERIALYADCRCASHIPFRP